MNIELLKIALLLILGLVLLIKGADWLVDGASALARRYRVSELAIGLTVVAFGTSAPELVVNTFAASNNLPDIVFGNIIGSNVFNLLAILGIAGLISPLAVQSSTVWKEIPLSLFAALLCWFLVSDQVIWHAASNILGRGDALILLVFFLGFLWYVKKQLSNDQQGVEQTERKASVKTWLFIIGGLAGLGIGGQLVVSNAVDLASLLGVSEKVIGLTIVAAGTSLPELATSVMAAIKKNIDIAVGNIIGSNIFNLLLILSASALVRPMGYTIKFNPDMLVLVLGTLFLFMAMFTGKKRKLDRWEAALMLLAFVGYTIYTVMMG